LRINEAAARAAGWTKVDGVWQAPNKVEESERLLLQETTRQHYRKLGLNEKESSAATTLEQRLVAGFGRMGLSPEESRIAARCSNDSRNGRSTSEFGASLEDLLTVERGGRGLLE
jgi:hypothetical protein